MSAEATSASKTGCFKQTLVPYYNSVLSILLKPSELMYYDNFSDKFLLWQPTFSINIYSMVKIILLINQSLDVQFCEVFFFTNYSTMLLPTPTPPSVHHTVSGSKQTFLILQHKGGHWTQKRRMSSITLSCTLLISKASQ